MCSSDLAKHIDNDLERFRAIGADGYLLKPFKPDDLLSMVQGFEMGERRVKPA